MVSGDVLFRLSNAVMAALFGLSVAVQYNDPDPLAWVALYGAACAISIASAVRRLPPLLPSVAVAAVALAWSLFWMATGQATAGVATHMFDAWEMKSTPIEEAREVGGLLITMLWMVVQCVRRVVVQRQFPPEFEPAQATACRR